MARTLTMRSNCLSLLNWLMKGLKVDMNVFFLIKWRCYLIGLWQEMKKCEISELRLWLCIIWCTKTLHYFNNHSVVGLIVKNKSEISCHGILLCVTFAFWTMITHFYIPAVAVAALKDKADFSSCLLVSPSLSLQEPEAHGLCFLLPLSAIKLVMYIKWHRSS